MSLIRLRFLVAPAAFLAAAATPSAIAQTTRTVKLPDETPRLLVTPFRANEKGVGPQTAEAVRSKITADVPIKQLYVIPRSTMCSVLESSGFNCDSVPDPVTSKLLATQLRADQYIDGTVSKTATGYQLDSRMVLTRDPSLAQPLPPATGAKLGDLAGQFEKSLMEARKQLPDEAKCNSSVRSGQLDSAVAAANRAIAAYPQSTIGRICLATALKAQKKSPDEILAVTNKVLEIDPRSRPALIMTGEAYREKGDTASIGKAVETWSRLIAAYPKDAVLVNDMVNRIAESGRADLAKPIIVKAVDDNPGDPDLVRLEWKVLLATAASSNAKASAAATPAAADSLKAAAVKDYDAATKVGETMVKSDTSAADTAFFFRQAAAYASANQPQKAAETTARGVAKFPNNANLWSLNSQTQRLAGQLQPAVDAAHKAIKLDPKADRAYLRLAQAQIDLGQTDSAVATLRQGLANGEDKATIGQFLLVLGNKAYKDASAANPPKREDFQRAVSILSVADSVAPTPPTKFVLGVSAFRVGDLAVRENATAKQCDLAKLAESSFTTAQIDIAAGGAVDPKTAQQLLAALQQYSPAVDGQKKKFCK
ncbi:MAG TPA: tetratricopeptide repeat protein [Gemmatimonadaceae bacterium]|nr:tetratricopeptide repeat protein [Gemmatimonadaceae bacterium]